MHAIALILLTFSLPPTFDALPREAMGQSPMVDGRPAVAVSLISQHDTLAPGGSTRLGVHFALSPNWHIYGANPGGSGFPTAIDWQIKNGTLDAVTYPPTQMFKEGEDVYTYGYSGTALLTTEVHDIDDTPGAIYVEARVRYLACNIICSPGEVTLRRTLPVTPGEPRLASPQIQAAFENGARALTGPVPKNSDEAALGLLRALGLALLGGLVLNLMPCVLPVLALKAMALMQADPSSANSRRHGVWYGVGVVGTTLSLGGVVMAVRAAGHSVGWGFQFQEPAFIATVATGLLLFAASCFGVFEVSHSVDAVAQAHHRATGMRRSLLEGVLAVLVATPCSAPFLGTAVAFALAQPNHVVALIFCAIGVGLALPFVALAFVPALGRFVPRPGPWMAHLKVLLGFCLLATCIWLVWLFGRARGVDDGAILMGIMLLAALGAWAIGLGSAMAPARLAPALGVWLVALAVLGHQTLGNRADGRQQAPLLAPFSEALVAAELQAGRPVLVDFTADWCITCKYNELHVLSSPVVQQALAARRVTVLRADFTRRDGELLAVLMRHGRAGVPMYLLYTPTAPDKPLLLPELLTINTLTAALNAL